MTKKVQTSGRKSPMTARPRLTLLAAGVSLALAPLALTVARADSGTKAQGLSLCSTN